MSEQTPPPEKQPNPPQQPGLFDPKDPGSELDKFAVQPEFWERLLDAMPDWGDEIAGIVLLVFGFVSFMALLDATASAPLALAWSNALTQLFGLGSVVVSAAIFGLGVLIFLPKFGVRVAFPASRILALEIAFIALLALLHLAVGDPELRAVARAGQGGGVIGGAVSSAVSGLFGTTTALVVFALVFAVSLAVAVGVKRGQVHTWLKRSSQRLRAYSDRVTLETQRAMLASGKHSVTGVGRRSPAGSLMRIRPDPNSLPPSRRAELLAASPPLGLEEPKAAPQLSPEELALFTRPEARAADLSGVGTVLPKRDADGHMKVERPDGRVKNYFPVGDFNEAKRSARRDKDLPALDLLNVGEIVLPEEEEINKNVVLIENTLLEFDIDIDVVDVRIGPTVTQYAVQPFHRDKTGDSARIRLSKIASYASDLELALSAKRLRMEIPVPGQSYMGIEVPNKQPSVVTLRSVYESRDYYERAQKVKSPLFIPLGRDVSGAPVGLDIGGCPHLLIAGTTGSGKSVAIAALTTALIMDNPPDQVKLVLMDPKMVELSRFNGLPHLIGPVETELDRIIEVLRWCTREMDRRYKVLEEAAARNIADYNARMGSRRRREAMPYIVIMIDEVGDLMMSKPEETEHAITRLAQMARAVGMHLVIATQRPSTDVITGLIKANFPTRIAFSVASGTDSRVILDSIGAETLLGQGDMLYLAQDAGGPRRLQGCYVGDEEVRGVVDHWKQWRADQVAAGKLSKRTTAPWERGLTRREFLAETDPMLEDAIDLVVQEQDASASMIQRRLGLGYPRAARIIDLMEELGIVGKAQEGTRSRKVLIARGKDPFKDIIDERSSD